MSRFAALRGSDGRLCAAEDSLVGTKAICAACGDEVYSDGSIWIHTVKDGDCPLNGDSSMVHGAARRRSPAESSRIITSPYFEKPLKSPPLMQIYRYCSDFFGSVVVMYFTEMRAGGGETAIPTGFVEAKWL